MAFEFVVDHIWQVALILGGAFLLGLALGTLSGWTMMLGVFALATGGAMTLKNK